MAIVAKKLGKTAPGKRTLTSTTLRILSRSGLATGSGTISGAGTEASIREDNDRFKSFSKIRSLRKPISLPSGKLFRPQSASLSNRETRPQGDGPAEALIHPGGHCPNLWSVLQRDRAPGPALRGCARNPRRFAQDGPEQAIRCMRTSASPSAPRDTSASLTEATARLRLVWRGHVVSFKNKKHSGGTDLFTRNRKQGHK